MTLYKSAFVIGLAVLLVSSCSETIIDDPSPDPEIADAYFPPKNSADWLSVSPEELMWDVSILEELYQFHESNGTRAFIILKKGKIVVEKYWGKDIRDEDAFDRDKQWYWASASKTLVALSVGIAQEQGHLNINDKTSKYIGVGWTSLPKEKEDLIKIEHQLTMTTGLDYSVDNLNCIDPSCLEYGSDAGSAWYYHNAPYTLIHKVVAQAYNDEYDDIVEEQISDKIGMKGFWFQLDDIHMYNSTARDAARFGLLLENNGVWANIKVISDEEYLKNMMGSSQEHNPSYGYLTWLNGKSSILLPTLPVSLNSSLAPDAPADLIAAMGKNGQFIDVIPSQDLVVIRMGEAPDNSLVPVLFHNQMWEIISRVIR